MAQRNHSCSPILLLAAAVGIASTPFCGPLRADPPPATQPVHSLLQQLSDDTQRLYLQSCHSMVRVQLPIPQTAEQKEFFEKWGPLLDPDVRKQILAEQGRAAAATHPAAGVSTGASTAATQADTARSGPVESGLMLYAVGLLVDDQGHAVFPMCVDRKYIGDAELPAVTGDGEATVAKFVGSDSKTNLTVMQLSTRRGTPAPLGHRRPEDGALTLTISRDGAANLVVWTNQHPEPGFAILTDGSVAGFGFGGHFLGAATAKPIVDQLIASGEVHRAVLGVMTQEVGKDDPIRRLHPALGNSPAIRILAVQDGSAAAAGGICKDDLVLTVGDQAVGDAPTFAAVIATRRGDTTLRVLRGSKVIELTVNLQPKP